MRLSSAASGQASENLSTSPGLRHGAALAAFPRTGLEENTNVDDNGVFIPVLGCCINICLSNSA